MTSHCTKTLLLLSFALTLLALAACGGGGGGEFTATSITFKPDGPGGAGDIWLELESANPSKNSFKLKVIGDDIKGVYGVAGRLEFDRSILALRGAKAGNALEGNSAQLIAAGGSNDEGGVFGVSRSKDYQHGVNLRADKVIGILEFEVKSAGTTTISFNTKRSNALNQLLDDVEVAHWLGGTLEVR